MRVAIAGLGCIGFVSLPASAQDAAATSDALPAAALHAAALEEDRAAEEACLCPAFAPGCYLASAGTWRRATEACDVQKGDPNYVGATLAVSFAFLAQTALYWADWETNAPDWDDPKLSERFTLDVIRFDNNPLPINYRNHPVAGAYGYAASRFFNLSVAGSFTASFLSSFLWEYGLEFRERVSVTDLIVTPGTGLALGEFFYRLQSYLWSDRADDGVAVDSLGFDRRLWHEFRVMYDGSLVTVDGGAAQALPVGWSVEGKFAALAGYLRPGSFSRTFTDANISEFAYTGNFGEQGISIDIFADTVILGHYAQSLRVTEDGLRGYAAMVGLGTAFHYRNEVYEGWEDIQGLFHLPGLETNLRAFMGPAILEAGLRVTGDFMAINAPAYDEWQAAYPGVEPKTPLRKQGYYNGLGWSERAHVQLSMGWLAGGGSASFGAYSSIEGIDRAQEEVDVDVETSDLLVELEAWLRVKPTDLLLLQWTLQHRRRTSSVGEFRFSAETTRNLFSGGVEF